MSNYRNNDLDRFAGLFKALANPNRLRIFLRLASCCPPGHACDIEDGRACIGDLGADLGLAPSTVSHHIKELGRAGLIAMKRSGQRIECWIPAEKLTDLADFFAHCCQGTVLEALQLPDRDFTRS
jgi:ArsR family transcriptional regulator